MSGYEERIRKLILRNKSLKNRLQVSKVSKGRKFSLEHRANIKKSQNTPEIIALKRKRMLGSKNPTWMGDKVSYRAIHMWMQNNFGKANKCENISCRKRSTAFDWANISGRHKRDRSDWKMLCRGCHVFADRKNCCRKGHPFTPENTYTNPHSLWRNCKKCRRERKNGKRSCIDSGN